MALTARESFIHYPLQPVEVHMNHSVITTASGARSQMSLSEVSKSYDGRRILDRIDLTVPAGHKVGVVGENGSGKSTLLKIIAGDEIPDSGDIIVHAGDGIGHAGQILELPADATVADVVNRAFAHLRDLEDRIGHAEACLGEADEAGLAEYGDLLTEYERRGGYEVDSRVAAAFDGLGLSFLTTDRELGTLSGGEQSRLSLATLMAAEPELILLDEPTNHLDAAGVGWLIRRLRQHSGTVIAVTHDRRFLTGFAEVIVEVDGDTGSVQRFGTGWQGYLAAKAAARHRWEQRYQDWRDEVARHSAATKEGAARLASKVRSDTRPRTAGHRRSHETGLSAVVRNAHERLRRLTDDPVPRPPDPLRFAGGFDTGAADPDSVRYELTDVVVPGRLTVPAWRIEFGQRLLVTGPNGSGKTTLLGVLSGDLTPATGKALVPSSVGYLRQELPEPAPTHSVLREFAAGRGGAPEEYVDELQSLGLLLERDFHRPVSVLSVGQRRRLELAKLVSGRYDVLLLDEPTNHLSPALVSEMEHALDFYEGTLIVVSHDEEFTGRFRGDRVMVAGGRLQVPDLAD